MSSDQQDQGLQASLDIDRATASRLGITPQLIDDTLYDAFGQRHGVDDFHPVEPIPGHPRGQARFPARSRQTASDIYLRSTSGGKCR